MDYIEIKQQAVAEIKTSVISLLKEMRQEVIASITDEVKNKYAQTLYNQELEIMYLKERVKSLEESISWAIHDTGIKL